MPEIAKLQALEILDSCGNPTVAVTESMANGVDAIAKVPIGASTGKREAVEIRDGDKSRYGGRGVVKAKNHMESETQGAIRGLNANNQKGLDEKLCELDGARKKARSAEDDQRGWQLLSSELGDEMQVVGDENFVTNSGLFQKRTKDGIANAILIKLNQIGTVTETLHRIQMARDNGYCTMISHRGGETDESSIADPPVAAGLGQIKTGSVCRGERIAKDNLLHEINRELGPKARYACTSISESWKRPVKA